MTFSRYHSSQAQEIKRLFTKTFSDSEGAAEGQVVGNLAFDIMTTTDEQDLYGFVAIEKDQEQEQAQEMVVGSIFFSRLTLASTSETTAFLLSPVAVHTDYQGRGIGQQLIQFGLSHLQQAGVALVVTYGDPNFYAKVGFSPLDEQTLKAPLPLTYPEGWLGQSLVGGEITPIAGDCYCVAALNQPDYW